MPNTSQIKHKHKFELQEIGAPGTGFFKEVCSVCGVWKDYV